VSIVRGQVTGDGGQGDDSGWGSLVWTSMNEFDNSSG
jgi:hypothetical protein